MSGVRGEVSIDEAFWQTVAVEFPEEVISVGDETGHVESASVLTEEYGRSLGGMVLTYEVMNEGESVPRTGGQPIPPPTPSKPITTPKPPSENGKKPSLR